MREKHRYTYTTVNVKFISSKSAQVCADMLKSEFATDRAELIFNGMVKSATIRETTVINLTDAPEDTNA